MNFSAAWGGGTMVSHAKAAAAGTKLAHGPTNIPGHVSSPVKLAGQYHMDLVL